jgi:hypothetical protein
MSNAGLGPHPATIADGQVPRDPDLASQDHLIAQLAAPGYTYLRDQDTISAYLDVMANLDQVVDLAPRTNPGLAQGGSIHTGIGPDLDIITDDDPTNLRELFPTSRGLCKTKAITAQDHP